MEKHTWLSPLGNQTWQPGYFFNSISAIKFGPMSYIYQMFIIVPKQVKQLNSIIKLQTINNFFFFFCKLTLTCQTTFKKLKSLETRIHRWQNYENPLIDYSKSVIAIVSKLNGYILSPSQNIPKNYANFVRCHKRFKEKLRFY